MKRSLQNKCDLFADNYKVLKADFAWGYAINNRLGALLYSRKNTLETALTRNVTGVILAQQMATITAAAATSAAAASSN